MITDRVSSDVNYANHTIIIMTGVCISQLCSRVCAVEHVQEIKTDYTYVVYKEYGWMLVRLGISLQLIDKGNIFVMFLCWKYGKTGMSEQTLYNINNNANSTMSAIVPNTITNSDTFQYN